MPAPVLAPEYSAQDAGALWDGNETGKASVKITVGTKRLQRESSNNSLCRVARHVMTIQRTDRGATVSDIGSNFRASMQDLKRRKVFRVGASYALVAWILLQVAEVTFPAFDIPDSAMRFLVILVIVGFPLTLVLAWLFDITPQGVKRTRETPSPTTDSVQSRRRWIDFAIIGVLAVVVAVLIYRGEWGDPRGSIAAGDRSIAVLPFVNMSNEPSNEYFSDGISEELLNVLARIETLRVAARTSSFAYKGQNQNVQEIGRALNVNTILEGSVRKSGDRLRVTAQLIDVESGYHLWSDTYEATLDDVFAIQDQIAMNIVEQLQLELFGADPQNLTRAPTASVEAYELYLLGRDRWHKRTEESLREAIGFFERALAIDPEYVRAYTGLADSYILLVEYGNLTNRDALPKAAAAIDEALSRVAQLPPDQQSEVYASQGLMLQVRGERTAATAAYEKSIALASGNAMAHMWYGNLLNEMQRPREALQQYEIAVQLEPMSSPANINISYALMRAGRYDEARQHFEVLVSLGSDFDGHYRERAATTYRAAGKLGDAVRAYRSALAVDPQNLGAMAGLAETWLDLGDYELAQQWSEKAVAMDWRNEHARQALNSVYMAQGNSIEAREMLEAWLDRKQQREVGWALNALALHAMQNGNNAEAGSYISEYLQTYSGEFTVFEENIAEVATVAAYYDRIGDRPRLENVLAAIDSYLAQAQEHDFDRPADHALRAAVLSLRDQNDAAAAAMLEAIRRGFGAFWMVDAHPVFASFRKSAGYEQVSSVARSTSSMLRAQLANIALPPYPTPPGHTTVTIASNLLDRYTGFYLSAKGSKPLEVVRDGNHLTARLGSLAPFKLLPEDDNRFFVPDGISVFLFVGDDAGNVTHINELNGGDLHRLKRVDYTRPETVKVAPAILDRYVGEYEFPESYKVVVTRDGEALYARPDRQPRVMLLPSAETQFFLLDDLAQIRFDVDRNGVVTGAVINDDGIEQHGRKLL